MGAGDAVAAVGATGGIVLNNFLICRHASNMSLDILVSSSVCTVVSAVRAGMLHETSNSSDFKTLSCSSSCSSKQQSILGRVSLVSVHLKS